jgi:60 kDa SS-A/Ro ribonucleoprotein
VLATLERVPVGPTDCSLPMIHAANNSLPVDVFVVYTDNETWRATDYSVADSNDLGMLNVVGFDASCPAIISNFARGM